jgi:hypothetical protein
MPDDERGGPGLVGVGLAVGGGDAALLPSAANDGTALDAGALLRGAAAALSVPRRSPGNR